MSDIPESTPSQPSHRLYSLLLKASAGLGTVILLGGVGFVIWGDRIITERILPRIEVAIEDAVDRPIQLGASQGTSFWGVRLGKTVIPPTATDESSVTIDAVEVSIGLRSLIFQRVIKPEIVLVRPQISLVQAEDGTWGELSIPELAEEDPRIKLELQSVEVRDAQLTADPFTAGREAVVPRETIAVDDVNGLVEFYGGEDAEEVSFDVAGAVETGSFDLKGAANLDSQAIKANVRTTDLPAVGINPFLPDSIGLTSGTLSSTLTVAAALTEEKTLDQSATRIKGTAQFKEGEFRTRELTQPISDIRSRLRFKGQQVTLEDTGLRLDDIVLTASGDVDLKGGYDLNAQIPTVSLAQAQTLAEVELPATLAGAADGTFQLDAQVIGQLNEPQVTGRLFNLEALQVDRLSLETVAADFALTRARFDLTELRVVPEAGGTIVADGQVDLTDLENLSFQLAAQADLPADVYAQTYGVAIPAEVVVGNLSAEIEAAGTLQEQTAFAQWRLSDSTFPGTGEITLTDDVVVLDNTRLRVAEGTVTAEGVLQLENGDWQAMASTDRVPVEQFTSQAEGLLSADVEASGNLDALNSEEIQAGGTAAIANAQLYLPKTNEPLLDRGDWTTAFEWQGNRVAVNSFTAPGVQANGTIGVDFTQSIPIGNLDLNVALQSFDLQPLNSLAPTKVKEYGELTGLTSFNGQLFGTLDNPQLEGDARLDYLAVNQLLFEPLTGPVSLSLSGANVDLRGQEDRLQLAASGSLAESFREQTLPALSFAVQNQEFVAEGYGEDRQLHADVVQFPLSSLDFQPIVQYGFGTVAGLLDASVDVGFADFSNPTAAGTLTIADPALSPVEAEQITASFAYANSTATLNQGELLFDDSRYLLTGSASLTSTIQYEGALTIAEGRIEDLVPIIEKLDLTSLGIGEPPTPSGSAADLATQPVGLPADSFLERLESFVAFVRANPPETTDPGDLVVPDLDELAGEFTGVIELAGQSLALADVTADFNVQGEGWEWGAYTLPNDFLVSGDVQQGTLAVETAFVNAGETQVDLSGSGNMDRLTGRLTVDKLPVELASLIYPLPARVDGDLDLVTTFGGSLANPVVEGEATVVDAQVNEQPIEQVQADFTYRNAVLRIDSETAVVPTSNPITLKGTIPYALPFMTVQPSTEQIALTAIVPNSSFEVINALTDDQVRWESGRGRVVVEVGGTLTEPVVAGQASFREGTIASSLLEDDLTDLNGDVQFDLEQVSIQQLQASMGDGQLAVTGTLPLLPSGQSVLAEGLPLLQTKQTPPASQNRSGLAIALQNLPVDYSDILQATLAGRVFVTGAVLAPTVSGSVEIDNGQIQANQLLRQAGSINLPTAEEVDDVNPYRAEYLDVDPLALQPAEKPKGLLDRLTLQNFGLTFGDRLVIAGSPFYRISALGDITVSGPLTALQPAGTIELKSGWINLFSTQFRLDSGAPNTATFTPENGLNPFVDVVMKARVQDADVTPAPGLAGGFARAEINESPVETIGSVQYINVQAVARGPASELSDRLILTSDSDRDQGELLALVGSGVFSGLTGASLTQVTEFIGAGSLAGFGDRVASAVGLDSFSVFPTTDPDSDSAVGIGIGVEASASIGNRFDISFLDILNSSNPPRLGVDYRFTDQLELQSASNLENTDFKLEYRIRF